MSGFEPTSRASTALLPSAQSSGGSLRASPLQTRCRDHRAWQRGLYCLPPGSRSCSWEPPPCSHLSPPCCQMAWPTCCAFPAWPRRGTSAVTGPFSFGSSQSLACPMVSLLILLLHLQVLGTLFSLSLANGDQLPASPVVCEPLRKCQLPGK